MKRRHRVRTMALSLAVVVLFLTTAPPLNAGGNVSYLYEPLLAQMVELQQLDSAERGYEMVPYEVIEDPSMLTGEVLQAAGTSPVSKLCQGATLTQGSYVCSEFQHTENVSNSGSGSTFSRDCKVTVVFGTYPAFFDGRDANGDGRFIPFDPQNPNQEVEWSDFANVGVQRGPDASFDSQGNMYPGDSMNEGYRNTLAPNQGDDIVAGQDFTERTEINTSMGVSSTSGSNTSGEAEITTPQNTMRIATDECEEDPTVPGAESCPSGKFSFVQTQPMGEAYMLPKNTQQDKKIVGRPPAQEKVCYIVDNVKYNVACINWWDMLTGWTMQFKGTIQNIECRVNGDCLQNVEVLVDTDSLLGTNDGCEEPCMDFSHDMYVSSMNAPIKGSDCSSYGMGSESPCWEDTYIGTPGWCRVCGKLKQCTLLWKNWVKDDYEWQKAGIAPCDPDDNPYCEWEGYWEEVQDEMGGLSLGT